MGLHGVQQLDPFSRDAGYGLPLILAPARAFHQPSSLQTIDQSGYIGSSIQHAADDFAARMTSGMHTAQDTEHVVLRARDLVLLAQPVHALVECVGGNDDAERRFLRRAGELRLLKAAAEGLGHTFFIARIDSPVISRGGEKKGGPKPASFRSYPRSYYFFSSGFSFCCGAG